MSLEELNRYEHTLANAFKSDLESLLLKFEALESYEFKDFVRVWKNMDFSLIYAGQKHAAELKLFTEMCFSIVLKYVVLSPTPYAQAGALFTLYGLYYKQPINCWIKIRITLEQYTQLQDFIMKMQSEQREEVLYVYAKLHTDEAFVYVAHDKPLGVELRFARSYEFTLTDMFQGQTDDAIQAIQELQNGNDLAEFDRLNEEYQHAMKQFTESHPGIMLPSFQTNLSSELQSIIKSHIENMKDISEDADSIHNRRKRLRKKAQSTINETRRLRTSIAVKKKRKTS